MSGEGEGVLRSDVPLRSLGKIRQAASVVSHKYGYEAARAFWLSARRDDL